MRVVSVHGGGTGLSNINTTGIKIKFTQESAPEVGHFSSRVQLNLARTLGPSNHSSSPYTFTLCQCASYQQNIATSTAKLLGMGTGMAPGPVKAHNTINAGSVTGFRILDPSTSNPAIQ